MTGGMLVAWWGAILGTIGSALSMWNLWRDRPQIKVSVKKDIRLTNNLEKNFILITAANIGKYPVYLSKAYFTLRTSSQSLLLTGQKTGKLEPGLSQDFICVQDKLNLNDLKEAIVRDAVGRKFKCKIPCSWQKTQTTS